MNDNGIVFNQNAQKIAFDDEHYEMMMTRYEQFMQNVENCTNYYSDLELEKQRALNIRTRAFKKLDKLLVDFDTNFSKNGGSHITLMGGNLNELRINEQQQSFFERGCG